MWEAQKRYNKTEKGKAVRHAWRQAHPEANRIKVEKYHDERRQLIDALRNKPCADCGQSYPPYVMDFDHLPGTKKEFTISSQGLSRPIRAILDEAAKCEVVCANCHRERTERRRLLS